MCEQVHDIYKLSWKITRKNLAFKNVKFLKNTDSIPFDRSLTPEDIVQEGLLGVLEEGSFCVKKFISSCSRFQSRILSRQNKRQKNFPFVSFHDLKKEEEEHILGEKYVCFE